MGCQDRATAHTGVGRWNNRDSASSSNCGGGLCVGNIAQAIQPDNATLRFTSEIYGIVGDRAQDGRLGHSMLVDWISTEPPASGVGLERLGIRTQRLANLSTPLTTSTDWKPAKLRVIAIKRAGLRIPTGFRLRP